MSTLVYKYGLLPPTEGAEHAWDEIRQGHHYRNDLVAIERRRRDLVRSCGGDAKQAAENAVEEANDACEALGREVKDLKSRIALLTGKKDVPETRGRSKKERTAEAARLRAEADELKAKLTAARLVHKEAKSRLWEARRAIREDFAADLLAVEAAVVDAHHDLRAKSRATWGTRGVRDRSAQQARKKMHLYDRDGLAPLNPRFQRWGGSGMLAVQIVDKAGVAPAELFGGASTQIQIAPVDWDAWAAAKGQARRRLARTTLSMRVGSVCGRNGCPNKDCAKYAKVVTEGVRCGGPLWARWPMIMHRPLPAGAVVKAASVHVERVADRQRWSVCLTIDVPDVQPEGGGEPRPVSAVAVDVGWRETEEGLRAAYHLGTDGLGDSLAWPKNTRHPGAKRDAPKGLGLRARRLASPFVDAMKKVDDIRAIRGRHFDATRDVLVAWLAAQAHVPDWLREATSTLADWRSERRLAGLARRWGGERFSGDEDAFARLEEWRRRDRHLWQYEEGMRSRAIAFRKDTYRRFAASLAERYDVLILEVFDKRTTQRKPRTEETDSQKASRRNQKLVAPSVLVGALKNAFLRRGKRVVEIDAAFTTKDCSALLPDGKVCEFRNVFAHQRENLFHVCEKCGTKWDQDKNACGTLIERWRALPPPDPARKEEEGKRINRKREGAWAKRKRLKAERLAAEAAAREAADKAAE